jgi:hypothetical protein
MWMFGRVWSPPNTVIAPLVSACIVSRLTVRSNRMRGEYPQTVAGRTMVVVMVSA